MSGVGYISFFKVGKVNFYLYSLLNTPLHGSQILETSPKSRNIKSK